MSNNNNDDDDDDVDYDDLFAIKSKKTPLRKAKEPNPFSFKEFLSSADTSEDLSDTLPDISPSIPKKSSTDANSANPYSFKQFVQPPSQSASDRHTIPIESLPTVTPSVGKKKPTHRQSLAADLEHLLPDCEAAVTIDDDDDDDDFDSPPKPAASRSKKKPMTLKEEEEDDVDVEDVLPAVVGIELPSLDELPNLEPVVMSSSLGTTADFENKQLRQQIDSNLKQLADQAALIKRLEKQIKTLRDREETENKTLEMMVQQVEQNLVKTTERAVKSEQHAETLKAEIKQLKAHVLTLGAENTQLKMAAKSATNNESQQKRLEEYAGQLEMASSTAETSLKQLLGGLESLRLISSSLKTFGKITEVSSSQD